MLLEKENRIVTSKYSKWSFFPLNMYHQLSKPSNMFFFLTMILLTIPSISPFNPFTYFLAFCLVTGTSMVKDGIEDYRRHKQDDIINQKPAYIIVKENDKTIIKQVYVEDINKGDLIIIKRDEDVPGDVVLLRSKIMTKKGLRCKNFCFVESSSLDGESNLKKKTSTHDRECYRTQNNSSSEFYLPSLCECDQFFIDKLSHYEIKDTGDLFNKFECKIYIEDKPFLCNSKNALLRGMSLKNTESVLAYVVAVGKESKLGRNNIKNRKGSSLFEKEITKIVMLIFVMYFLLVLTSSILGSLWLRKDNISYLYLNKYLTNESLKQTGTNYILFSYLIPLSLFVTLEVSRMFHSAYISHDKSMAKNDLQSICRNSNVTEDLGMIEYILSDKTGTLTKNKMGFKHVHLLSKPALELLQSLNYDKRINEEYIKNILYQDNPKNIELTKLLFILCLLCCNNVEPLGNSYEGISQDEVCILNGLNKNNIKLIEREESYVTVSIENVRIKCVIEKTLDFSSSRQRMSVVMKIFDRYFLFTKGSDQMLLNEKNLQFISSSSGYVSRLINENSKYRTLVVGFKRLSFNDINSLHLKFRGISLEDRYKQEEEIFSIFEDRLEYLGTTFIEDELQEDVVETIRSLKKANIKIWMITGDKKETAISCAIDCGIVSAYNDDDVIFLEGALINTEISIENILLYKSVIVYRSTPHQKGTIALKLKELKKNTLGIGDGNNDVPMLIASNVGVGILGKEGNQASLSGDFAIPDFKSLKKLILVHGRYNFIRFSKVTLNAFYKNIYLITIQYLYNFFTGFSGKPIYNNYFLNYYNVFFTSLIPLSICLFDKDHDEEFLLSNPEEYRRTRTYFSKEIILLGIFYGILQGVIIFILVSIMFYIGDMGSYNGKLGGYNAMNNLFSLVVFFSVLLGQIRSISYYVSYSYLAIFLSLLFNFITMFFIQDSAFEGNIWILTSIPVFYFIFIFLFMVVYMLELILSRIFNYLLFADKNDN